MLIPVGRSVWSIFAGYAALFSVLILPAPFALTFGLLALRDIKKNPKKHGKGRAWLGIIIGGFFTAILLFFLSIFIIDFFVSE